MSLQGQGAESGVPLAHLVGDQFVGEGSRFVGEEQGSSYFLNSPFAVFTTSPLV